MNQNNQEDASSKQVVAAVRDADYAHPGEETLIDLVLGKIQKDKNRSILDAGCGLGGTAFYMQKNGWGNVTGIDVDELAVEHARNTYPSCDFHLCNVLEINKCFENNKFDLITIFSAFYAFPEKPKALLELSKMISKDKLLIIYEYTDLTNGKNPFDRITPQIPHAMPINVSTFPEMLKSAGFELIEYVEMNEITEKWYAELLVKFEEKQSELLKIFSEKNYLRAYNNYIDIYRGFKQKLIGAGVFYAKKI